jgi:serine/threonine-protein kinase
MKFYLKKSFKFVHEPLGIEEQAIPFLANQMAIDKLKERITNSVGGTFLLTGFRGAGKTTVVQRAIEELLKNKSKRKLVIPIKINFARPLEYKQLLFEIIRRLFEALIDFKVLDKIDPEIAQAMTLAYARTSLSIKRSQSQSIEEMATSSWGSESGKNAASPFSSLLGALLPKLTVSHKKISALASEASFLAYTGADVEHDFLRIISLLKQGYRLRPGLWQRFLHTVKIKKIPPQIIIPRLVVVIDELDKLAQLQDGLSALDYVLNGMKNILTTSGVCFIFIGGPDLHDQWMRDIRKGNSIYESTFAWQSYISCTWGAAETFVSNLMESETAVNTERIPFFVDYLEYKGRGIPRRLIQEFNSFVQWENGVPAITCDDLAFERVTFYAHLQRILSDLIISGTQSKLAEFSIQQDRQRLATYYIVDWVLGTGGRSFSAKDILSPEQTNIIDPSLKLNKTQIEYVLSHLQKNRILQDARGKEEEQTVIGDVPAMQEPVYRLAENVWERLSRVVLASEKERADLKVAPVVDEQPTRVAEKALPKYLGAKTRQEILRRFRDFHEIGRGGMGVVYSAIDAISGAKRALKFLAHDWEHDRNAAERFLRESKIATRLQHPNFVKTYEILQFENEAPVIVMQMVEGTLLRNLIAEKALGTPQAVDLMVQICDAVAYAHKNGIHRLDIKPSNIIVKRSGQAVIVDLGIARMLEEAAQQDDITQTGVIVGTLTYGAPEQISGKKVDARADIYSLGVVLYEMLAGSLPWSGKDQMAILHEVLNTKLEVSNLEISEPLGTIISKATQRTTEQRFQSAEEMLQALEQTPEAAESVEPVQADSETVCDVPVPPAPVVEDG